MNRDTVWETRLQEAVELASSRGRSGFVGFLDGQQAETARRLAARCRFSNIMLWGGFPEAERLVFGAFPDAVEPREQDFPITALTARYRACDRLTHRDFLGALLHAGVDRSALGDILAGDGQCVFFCRSSIADFLLNQIEKIGGVGVRLSQAAPGELPVLPPPEEFRAVVASARLDCVVAASAGIGRREAAEMIRAERVQVNHETRVSVSAEARGGDVLSIRGKGRFIIDCLGPVTRKGRLSISGRKYK